MRDQRFPLALYNKRQVDYLVGLLGQKKKKKTKKKNNRKGKHQFSTDQHSDEEEPAAFDA